MDGMYMCLLPIVVPTISTRQFTHLLPTNIRTPKKRSRDHPDHVGGTKPLNGMQIYQKITTENNIVLKKVKLERGEGGHREMLELMINPMEKQCHQLRDLVNKTKKN